MNSPSSLHKLLLRNNIDFFAGVPDSLLKDFCQYIADNAPVNQHVITANEGAAVALATGYHLGSGRFGLVYMQNSGLGNSVNPLTSLTDQKVYSIPLLLLIGWRGEPDVPDEPQHVKQGEVMLAQLDLLDIPYIVLSPDEDRALDIEQLIDDMKVNSRPVAIVVRKNSFTTYVSNPSIARPDAEGMLREDALKIILNGLKEDALCISTTGKTSREVFEIQTRTKGGCKDFLTVGAMGHASSIALGVALAKPEKQTVILDGDGAMLMHMGSLPIIGNSSAAKLAHVLLNNQCHESVGGQPTVAKDMDIVGVAKSCGYAFVASVSNCEDLQQVVANFHQISGPIFLEVNILPGSRDDLGRPTSSPINNKISFMEHSAK